MELSRISVVNRTSTLELYSVILNEIHTASNSGLFLPNSASINRKKRGEYEKRILATAALLATVAVGRAGYVDRYHLDGLFPQRLPQRRRRRRRCSADGPRGGVHTALPGGRWSCGDGRWLALRCVAERAEAGDRTGPWWEACCAVCAFVL
jgi:hypothetical protein